MNKGLFSGYSSCLGGLVGFVLGGLSLIPCYLTWGSWGESISFSSLFGLNGFSEYLLMLCVLLSVVVLCSLFEVSLVSKFFVVSSLLSGMLCFLCSNIIFFWLCYEVSTGSLLFCIVLGSEYSERYKALVYLLGYFFCSSVILILGLLYLFISDDVLCFSSNGNWWSIYLSIVFVSKIPLVPFHSWLPLVHSESNWIVSICLSGYVMKLGVFGLYRFCLEAMYGFLFDLFYYCLCVLMSVYFLGVCLCELDCKRWLAFNSLSHMVACVGLFSFGCLNDLVLVSFYCLGHGVCVGLSFYLYWVFSWCSGSRSWFVMREVVIGSGCFTGMLLCVVSLQLCLPSSISLFSELGSLSVLIENCLWNGLLLSLCIFTSSLVCVFKLCFLLVRVSRVWYNPGSVNYISCFLIGFLCLISMILVFIL